jgi:hypothetical protein
MCFGPYQLGGSPEGSGINAKFKMKNEEWKKVLGKISGRRF